MKRFLCFAMMATLAFPFSAVAALRVLGKIGEAGTVDDKADHLALLLADGSEWYGVVSTNGGATWSVAKKESLPGSLRPLPNTGAVRYQLVDKEILLRSEDGGVTWRNVSPWPFLRACIREDVEEKKARFKARYGAYLPDDNCWAPVFGCSILALCLIGARVLASRRQSWFVPTIVSAIHCLLIGMVLYGFHLVYVHALLYEQWSTLQGHWGPVMVPLWPMGVALHLSGNVVFAPLTAVLCFPVARVYWDIGPRSASGQLFWRMLGVGSIVAVLAMMALGVLIGRGFEY